MTDVTFTSYPRSIKPLPTTASPSLYASTSSGNQIGAVYKHQSGSGWYGLVSGEWMEDAVSDTLNTREDAQNWLTQEVERQELQRSTNPDNTKYRVFSTRNGCRASTLLKILQIFDEHKMMVGNIAEKDNEFSALMMTPFYVVMQYSSYALPEMDKLGLREIRFLCAAQEPILEAMAAFPKDIKLHETVFLPLDALSQGPDAKFHPVADEIARIAEMHENKPQGRSRK
jgi:hypothetical protein